MGYQPDIVSGFGDGQPVVGQLHFTPENVIVCDNAFFLHSPDVLEPAFRLLNVPVEYPVLFVEAEQVQILLEQFQFDVCPVGCSLKPCDVLLQSGFADGIFDFSSLIERLGKIDGVVLLPVGSVGAGRIIQSALPYDRLSQHPSFQTDGDIRHPGGSCIAYALFGHLLFQTIGMKLEVLFRSPCKQLIQTDPEGIMLGIGGKRNA